MKTEIRTEEENEKVNETGKNGKEEKDGNRKWDRQMTDLVRQRRI